MASIHGIGQPCAFHTLAADERESAEYVRYLASKHSVLYALKRLRVSGTRRSRKSLLSEKKDVGKNELANCRCALQGFIQYLQNEVAIIAMALHGRQSKPRTSLLSFLSREGATPDRGAQIKDDRRRKAFSQDA
eukprot:1139894-Pelagomonas_calceolata.AAC.3